MGRENVIRMAQEAGLIIRAAPPTKTTAECLERFAELVAAAEREACAKLVEEAYEYESFGLIAAAIRARG